MANDAISFAEAVAENLQTVFLGQGHFDELLHYKPKGGVVRTLRGVVRRTQQLARTGDQTQLIESLEVLVSRDPACDVGGIDQPQIGDALRAGRDAANVWFGFSGDVPLGDAGGWSLKFTRVVPYQLGRGQTQ